MIMLRVEIIYAPSEDCLCSVRRLSMLRPKIRHSKNIPHSLMFSPEMPMYKGLRHVRDIRFSLTSPSHFSLRALPLGGKGTQNVRVMLGTFISP